MFCPTDRLDRAPGVVLRPMPEWGLAYAYTRARPALTELNATTWLIATLCDGATLAEIERDFAETVRRVAGGNAARDTNTDRDKHADGDRYAFADGDPDPTRRQSRAHAAADKDSTVQDRSSGDRRRRRPRRRFRLLGHWGRPRIWQR